MASFVPNPLRNIKQIRQTNRQRRASLCCASVFNIYSTHSKSLPQTVNNILFGLRAEGKTEAFSEKPELKMLFWGQTADCNEAPRGSVRLETKDPTGVLHTHRREVPIRLSSPCGFAALSGSVLLLATDQYILFYSFLVSLSLGPWGNVQKWQCSIKQLWPPISCQALLPNICFCVS